MARPASRHEPPTAPAPPPLGGDVWTVMGLVQWSGPYLSGKGVERGRLDAEYLLAHVLGVQRLDLYLQFDRPLTAGELAAFKPLLKRRAAREPLQYVLGSAPFRSLELYVDPRVLIPRPETEGLVDLLIDVVDQDGPIDALDLGTGSGALALSLALEGRVRSIVATDLSSDALDVARRNADRHGAIGVDFRQGPLFEPVAGETFDVVLSNPPYVSEDEWSGTEPEVRDWEPRTALVSGSDGLDLIRELIAAVPGVLRPGGWVLLEVGSDQTRAVLGLFEEAGCFDAVSVHEDLAGRSRYVVAQKTEEPGSRLPT